MSPQLPSLNRGRWKELEALVRSWAYQYLRIYATTGPVLNASDLQSRGPNKASIPNYYYKAVLLNKDGVWQAIGFILPNIEGREKESLESYIYTIDEIEEVIGFDLYPTLYDSIENTVVAIVNTNDWPFNTVSIPTKQVITEKVETNLESSIYWINSSSMTRHNSSCRYYNNTKSGFFTEEAIGEACLLVVDNVVHLKTT